MNEMMAKNSAPVVYGAAAFINGPELRDPRLNLEYTLFIKNKVDGEKFWVKYVSGDKE
jgi:hypothetical protein